jgi:hypothetical protein
MTIPVAFLDELRARVPVSEVVGRRVLLRKAGREWKGLSPFNKERSPSFFVNDQKGFYHDFSSGKHGDIFAFVMEMEGLDFRPAVEKIAAIAGATLPDCDTPAPPSPIIEAAIPREPDDDERARQRRALEIWEAARDIGGTLAAKYLTGRKLALPEGVSGQVMRFHPRCPWRNDTDELVYVPALIGLFRAIDDDKPCGIHRTALTDDGRKLGRRALGRKAGAAIKLTADEDVEQGLHIGEGVETMLAATMFGFAPAWAMGDTSGMRSFPVLDGIDALTIIVDHDENGAGQAAASECFDRWTAARREVWCVLPDGVGVDMNDIVAGDA